MKDSHHGVSVNWLGYLYRFIVGKSATPFYYIVVLIQLTVITPRLVNVVKESKIIKNLLWLITPCYLLYIYMYGILRPDFRHVFMKRCSRHGLDFTILESM